MIDRSLILQMTADVVIRTATVFALFLLFRGHNAPGGGFVAGLVIVAGLMIRLVAGGWEGARTSLPAPSEVIMGAGLTTALLTGTAGWLWGDAFLEAAKVTLEVPVLGAIHLTSALVFDIGVFMVVVGMGAKLILSLAQTENGP